VDFFVSSNNARWIPEFRISFLLHGSPTVPRNLSLLYVEIKFQLDATEVFIADLIAYSTFRAPLCPSSGAQEYYTVVAAFGIS
jgi:hypothetical protein